VAPGPDGGHPVEVKAGPDRLRRLRVAAQLLHRPRRMAPSDAVRHLVGVQAQVLPAASLALRARALGLTPEAVERARLEERSIVLTWAMRGTLNLITPEDYGRFVPLVTEPRIPNAFRRLKEEGVDPDQAEKAVGLIERALERGGPLIRRQLADRLSRQGIRTEGQAIAHLVWLAASQRGICFGPDKDGDRSLVLARDWLGTTEPAEPERALRDLAVRYLAAHGPAGPEDLVAWSGLRLRDARAAWRAIADRLVDVDAPGGRLWTLRSAKEARPGVVRLLPAFDEFLLGWKDRGFAVQAQHWKRINAGGGWLHPVVLADGRAVGTWKADRPGGVEIAPFARLSSPVRKAVEAEVEEVTAFLEATRG